MSASESFIPLQMVWPEYRLTAPPAVQIPPGFEVRTYRRGDEPQFFAVMEAAGFQGWNNETLQPLLMRMLPEGWFMGVHTSSGKIVATAITMHSPTEEHPFGGEVHWIASDPAYASRGLGMAVAAAATRRLIEAGYRNIHLFSDDHQLPALKIGLKMGYVPWLYTPEMEARWKTVCEQIQWPFTPEVWRRSAERTQA